MEDLDASVARRDHEFAQRRDLETIGLDWDGAVMRQSDRQAVYDDAIEHLRADGLTYPCYCSRREIQSAVAAPHGDGSEGGYPGFCRDLSTRERARRDASGRRSALRLRADGELVQVKDELCGSIEAVVDDFVLRRADGVVAYNLAVVVDDAAQGIEQVVRGDDLLRSSPRQRYLAERLRFAAPSYAHVPLVLGPDRRRLAKRDGAVTLFDRQSLGESVADVVNALVASCGLDPTGVRNAADALATFDPSRLGRGPWVLDPSCSFAPD